MLLGSTAAASVGAGGDITASGSEMSTAAAVGALASAAAASVSLVGNSYAGLHAAAGLSLASAQVVSEVQDMTSVRGGSFGAASGAISMASSGTSCGMEEPGIIRFVAPFSTVSSLGSIGASVSGLLHMQASDRATGGTQGGRITIAAQNSGVTISGASGAAVAAPDRIQLEAEYGKAIARARVAEMESRMGLSVAAESHVDALSRQMVLSANAVGLGAATELHAVSMGGDLTFTALASTGLRGTDAHVAAVTLGVQAADNVLAGATSLLALSASSTSTAASVKASIKSDSNLQVTGLGVSVDAKQDVVVSSVVGAAAVLANAQINAAAPAIGAAGAEDMTIAGGDEMRINGGSARLDAAAGVVFTSASSIGATNADGAVVLHAEDTISLSASSGISALSEELLLNSHVGTVTLIGQTLRAASFSQAVGLISTGTSGAVRVLATGNAGGSANLRSTDSSVLLRSDTRTLAQGDRVTIGSPEILVSTGQGSADIDAVSSRSLSLGGRTLTMEAVASSRSKAVELSAQGHAHFASTGPMAVQSYNSLSVKSTNAGSVNIVADLGDILMSSTASRVRVRGSRIVSDSAQNGLTVSGAHVEWNAASIGLVSGGTLALISQADVVSEAKGGLAYLAAVGGQMSATAQTLDIAGTGSFGAGAWGDMQVRGGAIQLRSDCGVLTAKGSTLSLEGSRSAYFSSALGSVMAAASDGGMSMAAASGEVDVVALSGRLDVSAGSMVLTSRGPSSYARIRAATSVSAVAQQDIFVSADGDLRQDAAGSTVLGSGLGTSLLSLNGQARFLTAHAMSLLGGKIDVSTSARAMMDSSNDITHRAVDGSVAVSARKAVYAKSSSLALQQTGDGSAFSLANGDASFAAAAFRASAESARLEAGTSLLATAALRASISADQDWQARTLAGASLLSSGLASVQSHSGAIQMTGAMVGLQSSSGAASIVAHGRMAAGMGNARLMAGERLGLQAGAAGVTASGHVTLGSIGDVLLHSAAASIAGKAGVSVYAHAVDVSAAGVGLTAYTVALGSSEILGVRSARAVVASATGTGRVHGNSAISASAQGSVGADAGGDLSLAAAGMGLASGGGLTFGADEAARLRGAGGHSATAVVGALDLSAGRAARVRGQTSSGLVSASENLQLTVGSSQIAADELGLHVGSAVVAIAASPSVGYEIARSFCSSCTTNSTVAHRTTAESPSGCMVTVEASSRFVTLTGGSTCRFGSHERLDVGDTVFVNGHSRLIVATTQDATRAEVDAEWTLSLAAAAFSYEKAAFSVAGSDELRSLSVGGAGNIHAVQLSVRI